MKPRILFAIILTVSLLSLNSGAVIAQPAAGITNTPAYMGHYTYAVVDGPANHMHVAGSVSAMYNSDFGIPWYAYYDTTHHTLKEAWFVGLNVGTCDGGSNGWGCQTVDDGNKGVDDVGLNNSIAEFGSWTTLNEDGGSAISIKLIPL